MSRKRDDEALGILQDDIRESDSRRSKVPPTNPAEWLAKVMTVKRASAEDVADKTKGLSVGAIRRLLRGERPFTEEVCEELKPWLGPRAAAFFGICRTYAYFAKHGERPPRPPVPDTAEARETAQWYADFKRRRKISPAPGGAQ